MKFDDLLTVAACCCCDLKTGALVLGYIELAFSVLSIMWGISDPVSFGFLLNVGFGAMNFAFVYGIHQNKPEYMLANILWSLETAFICIGIQIYSMIGILGFSDFMMKLKDLIPQMKPDGHGTPSGQDIETVTSALVGLFIVFWSIWSLVTFLAMYFAKVKYSLYQAMDRSYSRCAAPAPFQSGGMSTVNIG